MKTILLTGFDPFDGEQINPSYELVKLFNNKQIQDYLIIAKQLPTVFYESKDVLKKYLEEFKPDIVLCLGQAGMSTGIRVEKVAINLNDARILDNKGNQPVDEIIIKNSENAYFSKLPVRAIYNELVKQNIPASISYSAGTFVCNHIFYHLINEIKDTNTIGGFIHIPYIKEQVVNKPNAFAMDLTELEKALQVIIETCMNNV